MTNIYQFSVKDIDSNPISMKTFEGKTLLIVNTASECGFTPQLKGLEQLYQQYKNKGFVVLGFPCNQFGKQEPGSEKEIAQFCELNYQVTFPLFSKVDVNGKSSSPLFEYLKSEAKGILGTESIKWNFTKFLVNKEGSVVERFASKDKPESIEKSITAIL
ncbi:glutathione peroxidase [Aliikangiella sp. IMCC44359]|uniref:glutathione peroxidase n=1 Tax=Aliikangiella sp. IMCC44359 TaxID=3459125 RepID=UPI00403B0379